MSLAIAKKNQDDSTQNLTQKTKIQEVKPQEVKQDAPKKQQGFMPKIYSLESVDPEKRQAVFEEFCGSMLDDPTWYKLANIEKYFPTGEIIKEHRDAGVAMYYSDEDTPQGFSKCLLPDGTVKIVPEGQPID